jgi:hypothetical protein
MIDHINDLTVIADMVMSRDIGMKVINAIK